MSRNKLVLLLAWFISTCVISPAIFAEGTRTWEQSKFEDLIKGTANGIAFPSEGGLELAPAFKSLTTLSSTYIWSIASDSAGNIYAAAGAPARVYRITPDGKSAAIFEPQELHVQALVVAKNGVVYAATSPDGKVYRLANTKSTAPSSKAAAATKDSSGISSSANWSASVYFDPSAKYIWDLALDYAGNLYVATGDHGEIYKVNASGQNSLFFKSDEVHIRVLALDPKGNLIAGSDGSGLIYRISPNGDAFVLYSAPKKEITALAIDSAGNIYAAAAGEKHPGSSSAPGLSIPAAPASASSSGGITITASSSSASPSVTMANPGAGATGGSEIYRIAPDGAPEHLWSSHEDLVYALSFDQRGRLVAGTGNRGHIFAINDVDNFTDLVQASATQVTAFAPAPGGGLYASSSNLGKIFVLGPGPASEGSYESDVFDAHGFSRWGRATMRSTGNLELYARSGNVDNPDRNWSPWRLVDTSSSAELKIPPARFVQWKVILHGGSAPSRQNEAEKTPARVDSVLLYYLPKNVAPVIDEITVQPGYRYSSIAHVSATEPPAPGQSRFDPLPPAVRDRDSIGIHWQAHDDNDDQLVYSVYYRADGESRWLLLKSDLTDRFYSFDASLLPDGGYTVMVVASDSPSHSPGDALYAQKVSARFEVDNAAPTIDNLTATLGDKSIRVRFSATDSFSAIKRAEYSIDGGDWQFVEPLGQLSDAKTENYDFRIAVPESVVAPVQIAGGVGSDHVIVVRAYDRFDNLASAKVVVRGK